MKSNKLFTAKSARFRRWSRGGYAIFSSLACRVTIGSLAVSISDKSLQKATGVAPVSLCVSGSDAESSEQCRELADLETALLEAQELSLTQITFDRAAVVRAHQLLYRIFNQNG